MVAVAAATGHHRAVPEALYMIPKASLTDVRQSCSCCFGGRRTLLRPAGCCLRTRSPRMAKTSFLLTVSTQGPGVERVVELVLQIPRDAHMPLLNSDRVTIVS
jgi:hypothetical protein